MISAPAKAAQYEFKCAPNEPLDHPSSGWLKEMWSALERESGGRIRAEFFPNGVLGGKIAVYSAV